jgi:capsular exopolysaccharide synthesis family protein
MSRLFEALQTYTTEVSGGSLLDASSIPADILKEADKHEAGPVPAETPTVPDTHGTATISSVLEEVSGIRERTLMNAHKVRTFPAERMVSMKDEHSLAAEKFRFLAVRLRYLQQRTGLKRVLVTSTIAEEGKSFVATNLAVTLARKQRQRVLLIEGDLRRPNAAQAFGLPPMEGMCESLADPDGGERIFFLQEPKIWFIPAGSAPENPLELLQSARLPELMNRIVNWFDWIIIDSPPILPLADTTVWSRLSDGTIVIAREGKTQKRELTRGLQALDKSNIVGVVINSSSSTDNDSYYQRYGYLQQQQVQ